MFDKLEDLLIRFEEIMSELNEPSVTGNQERFRRLMKEQSDLTPIVEAYKEYKKCGQDVADSLAMLEEESDEDMREMLKEELSLAKKRIEELEEELLQPLCSGRNQRIGRSSQGHDNRIKLQIKFGSLNFYRPSPAGFIPSTRPLFLFRSPITSPV